MTAIGQHTAKAIKMANDATVNVASEVIGPATEARKRCTGVSSQTWI